MHPSQIITSTQKIPLFAVERDAGDTGAVMKSSLGPSFCSGSRTDRCGPSSVHLAVVTFRTYPHCIRTIVGRFREIHGRRFCL